MNERIKKIGKQAGFAFIEDGVYGQRWYSSKCGMDASEFEKFAQLIVNECCAILNEMHSWQTMNNQEYSSTWHDAVDQGIDQIKEHFGVKE